MKDKLWVSFGYIVNLALLIFLIFIWSWCSTPNIYVSHPFQHYFLPLFVVGVYLWMVWILVILFILVKRFFLAKNQFIFSYICLMISLILFVHFSVDLINHFIKPAFFTGWIPYFNNTVSKRLLYFWIPSHLNYLLLYTFIVLSKKGIDNLIDSKKTQYSLYWAIGWVVTFLSGCVWAFLLSFKEKYNSWTLLFDKTYIFQSWLNQTEKWPNHVPMLYFTKIILLFVITCVVLILLLQPDKPVEKLAESSTGSTASTTTAP